MNDTLNSNTQGFDFLATCIGSVPYLDVEDVCERILELFPRAPFWPQFVNRSPLETMILQFSEGLPFLELVEEGKALSLRRDNLESELVSFYEHFLGEDLSYFAVGRKYSRGLYEVADAIRRKGEKYGPYIKGQTVGPITFAAGVSDHAGHTLLQDPELLEAVVKGLSIKALWQVRKLEETGKRPILFIDEPYLSGFGSAFTPLEREEVVKILGEIIGYLRERSQALIGVHCCGNTDWSMIADSGPDIISFDAYEYLDTFLLYPDSISRFVHSGGAIAWGIVPTFRFTGKESVEALYQKLCGGLNRLRDWGLGRDVVVSRSLLTPACGMGTMTPALADRALDLLVKVSRKCRDLF
ncbi:MAG: hypothetical protein JRH06_06135 [Deltaproteobacteria bacterium]|nr:hypothetical protein [Deltaproteobacteria bacterium]